MSGPPLPHLLTEADAYNRFGKILEDKELRLARKRGELGYYRRKGQILYREDELLSFVKALLEGSYVAPCRENTSSSSASTGSIASRVRGISTASGMTPELEKSAADLLRQQISSKPK